MTTEKMGNSHEAPRQFETPRQKLIFLLFACSAGAAVANVYFIQPITVVVAHEFSVASRTIAYVSAITQVGYSFGILLLSPLGDTLERKKLILFKLTALAIVLGIIALSSSFWVFCAGCVLLGLLSSVGQDFVPAAAQLAPEGKRGVVVGLVTTGLLTGILLSRTFSGAVSDLYGWRTVYVLALSSVLLVMGAVLTFMPRLNPISERRQGYLASLREMVTIWSRYPALRFAAFGQGAIAVSLGAFWSTLAIVLATPPYGLTAGTAGAFGLAGAAGAFLAPVFGRVGDKFGRDAAISVGSGLVILSFVAMLKFQGNIAVLVIGAIAFDAGVMASLVSNQALVTGLLPEARSRMNGILMTCAMLGVAGGSTLAAFLWPRLGWTGTCILGLLAGFGSFACLQIRRRLISP